MKLTMCKGLPASGKTTWAKTQNAKRVNKDDLRQMIDNGVWSKGNERFIVSSRNLLVRGFLENGESVIVDDTNLSPNHEHDLREIALDYNAEFEVKDFTDVPLSVCLTRDKERAASVGEKVILKMYNQFLRYKSAGKPLDPLIFDPALPMCVIFDIDGTLACIGDRSPYDAKSCASDLPNTSIIGLNHMAAEELKIFIFSGRTDDARAETLKWLDTYDVSYDGLYMRKTGDLRKDSVIKQELFNAYIKDKFNVLFVVDDRNQVVELWRSLGITCLQVADGNF